MRFKYIVIEIDGEKVPVIFGEKLSHKGMLQGTREALRQHARESRNGGSWAVEPVSAGFVEGLHVDNVSGYSESMRYGHGYIENHELTKAHPEIDLPLINGRKFREPNVDVTVTMPEPTLDDLHRTHIITILKKTEPSARHLSYKQRFERSVDYARTHVPEIDSVKSAYVYVQAICKELGYHV
jgi:hypothetical protein